MEAINQASSAEMDGLAVLIKTTKILKGHDKIITAWNERRKVMLWGTEDLGVPANLRTRQQAITENTWSVKKGFNLDELQQETKKLLSLLENRQPGLMTWNEFLYERLQGLYKLTSQALGK